MLKSIKFLREKSRGRAGGGGTSVCSVILRRYSQLEVPWRRIHNVIAHAMSVCVAVGNKVMDTRLPQPAGCGDKYDVYGWCWERGFSLGASKQRSVAVGNKVRDTRLPQPAGCGDKYDVSGWCWERGLSAFNTFAVKAMSILAFLCLFATAAEAKICFLPDGSCGTSKITEFKTSESGCQYKTDAEARNGLGACETTYKQNMCYYRRCKNQKEDSTVFESYEDCQKNVDSTQECTSCGSCYKLVTKPEPKVTCNETEASCSAKDKGFEANGTYDSDNVACGSCKPIDPKSTTCAEMGYKTCASCISDQICELNGIQDTYGQPCAKGCRNPEKVVCDDSSAGTVAEKYVYLKKLIDGLAINKDAFTKIAGGDFDLYEIMKKANLLQSNWVPHDGSDGKTYIDDKQGNLLCVFTRNDDVNGVSIPRVHVDLYLNKTIENLNTHQIMPISDCVDVYKNLMKPLYCKLNRVGIYSTNYSSDKMTASYGKGACGGGKTCLKDISDGSINAACNSCLSDNVRCYMPIIFGKGN